MLIVFCLKNVWRERTGFVILAKISLCMNACKRAKGIESAAEHGLVHGWLSMITRIESDDRKIVF